MHLVQPGDTHRLPCRRVKENDCRFFFFFRKSATELWLYVKESEKWQGSLWDGQRDISIHNGRMTYRVLKESWHETQEPQKGRNSHARGLEISLRLSHSMCFVFGRQSQGECNCQNSYVETSSAEGWCSYNDKVCWAFLPSKDILSTKCIKEQQSGTLTMAILGSRQYFVTCYRRETL